MGKQAKKSIPDRHLLVVGGATASGKTGFAIRLAQHFNTEILSCDSRQFYREMNIGTAKPTDRELTQVPHHFIGHIRIQNAYSVGHFERDALQLLDKLFQRHRYVVVCGGSGLFIKALCEGLDAFPEVPAPVLSDLQRDFETHGISLLQEELSRTDPEYYAEVDLQNPRRLLRALSVIRTSGRPYSAYRQAERKPRNFHPVYLQMDWPRELLYERINRRVDEMMEAGLLEEVRKLYPFRDLQALQTVGYQELFDHLSGLTGLEEAVSLIKRNSRRYAKRQLTWFRRDTFWKAFHPEAFQEALAHIGQNTKV